MEAGAMKVFWMISGIAALCAGIVGLFLPLLPTVPFVLLAAYCFSRGNKRWERWMLSHPRLGPIIVQWRQHRVVPLNAKRVATVMMAVSSLGAWVLLPQAFGWIPAFVCMLVAVWLWRFPHQIPDASQPNQMPPDADDLVDQVATGRRDWFAVSTIALLMLSHALPYAWATVTLDTARDLAAAYRIVDGEVLLRGPQFNGLFHLGPIWFYLLAPVLALTKSQAWTLLWVGFLAALKFPLAYRIGRSIRDTALGLCLAGLMALPGWSSLGSMFPTHTVMVEAAVLLQLLLMLRLSTGASCNYWAWLGLVGGLALHAHPSAAFVLLLVPIVLWTRRRIFQPSEMIPMLLGALLFVLPLLPMVLVEWREGWPAFGPTLAFAKHSGTPFALSTALNIAYGAVVEGPKVALGLVEASAWTRCALISMGILAVLGLLGNFRRGSHVDRVLLALAILMPIALSLLLAGLRDYTPFYMGMVLIPFGCMAIALGLSRLPLVRVWILIMLALAVFGSAILIASAEAGRATVNVARTFNVANATPKIVDAALLPAWQLDALGREFCGAEREQVLHGYLAVLYDASLALGPELKCGKRSGVALSGAGTSASEHWLGLPPALALHLGLQEGPAWNDTPRFGVEALWPEKSLEPADRLHYPHHRGSDKPAVAHQWRVSSAAGSVLVTTDLLYPYRVNRVETVFADQQPARLLASANVTSVWACDHCSGAPIQWEVRGTSNDPDALDIVAIATPKQK
jgi:uncharacterized membrane protein YbaN (DUF454 family)